MSIPIIHLLQGHQHRIGRAPSILMAANEIDRDRIAATALRNVRRDLRVLLRDGHDSLEAMRRSPIEA